MKILTFSRFGAKIQMELELTWTLTFLIHSRWFLDLESRYSYKIDFNLNIAKSFA